MVAVLRCCTATPEQGLLCCHQWWPGSVIAIPAGLAPTGMGLPTTVLVEVLINDTLFEARLVT